MTDNKKIILNVEGMTCTGCERTIEAGLKKLPGIEKVRASFTQGTVEYVQTDPKTNQEKIRKLIADLGYSVVAQSQKPADGRFTTMQFIGVTVILLAVYVILKNTVGFDFLPKVAPSMGYAALFIVGLVTSLHCVAMCGGINLSQCMKYSDSNTTGSSSKQTGLSNKLKPSILYNSGRVISYTVLGGLAGLLGSAVSFTGVAKGIVAVVSGIFMIVMGLNLFGAFPWIRKFIPRFPSFLQNKKTITGSGKGPLVVGLLNGLIPCGPLQAMQLYALGTGSFLAGAMSMFFFSLGTVPLMFGLGMFSTLMSAKFNKKMMQVGALLVVVLGLVMMTRGFALSGINIMGDAVSSAINNSVAASDQSNDKTGVTTTVTQEANATVNVAGANTTYVNMADANATTTNLAGNDVQMIDSELTARGYPVITVKKGIPVRWNLKANADDITGCNGTLVIPKYKIEKKLEPGDNIIEFTPTESGTIPYSCWMGMIRSKIIVEQ